MTRKQKDLLSLCISEAAEGVMHQHQHLTLTAEEQATFVKALLNPAQPDPRLRAAALRYRMAMTR